MLHKRPVASTLVYTLIIFVKSVKLCINCCLCSLQTLRQLNDSGRHFVWRALATFLSINLISTFCTQFHLYALNFNFLHCLGLIDVLSANELAEMFACVLLLAYAANTGWIDLSTGLSILTIDCNLTELIEKNVISFWCKIGGKTGQYTCT